jgi:hypothetical protein
LIVSLHVRTFVWVWEVFVLGMVCKLSRKLWVSLRC